MKARRASPSVRFAAFALAGIVLPAAILAVLGFHSLRQWETSADLLFREQAREMAAMAAEKAEALLRRTEDEILARLQAIVAAPRLLPAALQELRASAPLIGRLYLLDGQGRLLFSSAPPQDAPDILAALRADLVPAAWAPGGRRRFLVGEHVVLGTFLKTADGRLVCAAFAQNPEVFRREILAKSLGALDGPTVPAVLDGRGRSVYVRGPAPRDAPIVTTPFGKEFPEWRVALYQPPGASPQAAVRRQTTLFSVAFGLLLLVIVAGLGASYRLVRRETEMARLKADFVANVSHDLKTPLALIRMFSETLEMGRVPDETARQEYYRIITRESERLSRLINNVLDFSRIEGGQRQYQTVATEVEPLVREVLDAFAYVLGQRGFTLHVTVAPGLPPVPLDPDAFAQALGNLVDNAIKYSGEGRTLRVEAGVRDGYLAVAVADEGLGIPPEEHGRIFEKFYRGGRSETQGRRGSGVGLALVRHIAEAHGGRVTVESRPGAGSRFTLWFPLRPPPGPV
jgi:signal transduction histidine kinase